MNATSPVTALTDRLAGAARRTADMRPAVSRPAPQTVVADAAGWCCKPWATDGCGTITEVCGGRPAHHGGPCGPADLSV